MQIIIYAPSYKQEDPIIVSAANIAVLNETTVNSQPDNFVYEFMLTVWNCLAIFGIYKLIQLIVGG